MLRFSYSCSVEFSCWENRLPVFERISCKSLGFVFLTNQVDCAMLITQPAGVFFFFLCTGLSDPYCEVSMGSQEHRTKVVPQTLNPKWNSPVSLAKHKTFYCAFYLLCQRFRVSLPSVILTDLSGNYFFYRYITSKGSEQSRVWVVMGGYQSMLFVSF